MERIKSFEEACNALKIETTVPDYSYAPEEDRAALEAHYKLVIIAKALNEGWKPNWNDHNEYKHYPWFYNYKSGVGFSHNDYDYSRTLTTVGSRLCFKSSE